MPRVEAKHVSYCRRWRVFPGVVVLGVVVLGLVVTGIVHAIEGGREVLFKLELESELSRRLNSNNSRGSSSYDESDYNSDFDEGEEEEEEEYSDFGEYDYYSRTRHSFLGEYPNSGSDNGSDDSISLTSSASGHSSTSNAAPVNGQLAVAASVSNTGASRTNRRGIITGTPGSYYGGYGRCFSCGARGHWAPGCPFK